MGAVDVSGAERDVGGLTATATALASSANPALTGQAVTYTATVTGGDGGGSVSFTDAGFPVTGCQNVALNAGTASCPATYTDPVSHQIAAIYNGDATSAASVSTGLTQSVTVAPPATAPTVATTNLVNGAAVIGITAPPAAAIRPAVTVIDRVIGYNLYQGTAAGKESSTPVNPSRILATARGYIVRGLKPGTKYSS